MSVSLHVSALDAIPSTTLYEILWLRVSVFVVEWADPVS
ncbi:putative GNAT family N-acyltransferase [Microbacterium marinum]|uniref:Putative GNAT family N-acyltransferase n=1 Tax=Microbacterium marinum TaxID=421115 RepID=A0A7W7BT66_9MICO|nr:putative GNAT family N-acyltransferase [Microbacterium marinum]